MHSYQWSTIIKKIFFPGSNQENDRRESTKITKQLKRDFEDVFSEIGCFDGMFSLQVNPETILYQVPLRLVVYELQKPFKEELEWLQQQDIITPLGVDETA